MSTAHRFRPETDRERAQLANAFVRYDPAEAGPQVQGVLEIVLFPALHAWEAAMAALSEAERALEARRMLLRDKDAAFGEALTQLAWTLRQPAGAPISLGPVLGAPLAEALAAGVARKLELAAALEQALEVGRVRGDADRRAALTVAAGRLGVADVARDDAARARIQAAATAKAARDALDPAVSRAAQALDAMVGTGVARRFLPTFPQRRRASALPAAQEGAGVGVAESVSAVPGGGALGVESDVGTGVEGGGAGSSRRSPGGVPATR
jgi:hypothetical protein